MEWRDICIGADTTIRDALAVLTNSGRQICLVTDGENRLLGTVTDGDIRRGILRSVGLEAQVAEILNPEPFTATENSELDALITTMTEARLYAVPLIDDGGRVIGLRTLDEFVGAEQPLDNLVVLMAGGLGTRLRPITETVPKPLLKIGNKPILETILESFVRHRFRRFYISVNYKADMIKAHFGDGQNWRADLKYLEENESLGTAGALRLIKERPDKPLIIMNGDLLTRVNFRNLLDYHHEQNSKATMCVREYDMEVPFGVVRTDGQRIVAIDEKPVHSFLVNAGIYVIEPELIDLIPETGRFDMTSLFERAVAAGDPTAAFPIREYWLDVGRIDDLNQANWEYREVFSD